MAEENLPIFKSEGQAFDRAKINAEIRSGNTGAVTQEIGESMRAADKVTAEAKSFYDKVYNEELKALDPAYDKNDPFYQYAYSSTSSDKRDIQEKIEEGQAVDGKEIVPIAKQAAGSKVGNAKSLKSGTVTQIAEQIGIKEIRSMEEFDNVASDFDSKTKDEKLSFGTLLSSFSKIIGQLNEGLGIGVKLPKETQLANDAIISALAKILEAEGIKNESISKMSERYEENLKNLINSKDKQIEGLQEEEKTKEQQETQGVLKTEEPKIETATSSEKAAAVEGNKQETTEPSNVTESKTEAPKVEAIESATTTATDEEKKTETPTVQETPTQIQSAIESTSIESTENITEPTSEPATVSEQQKIEQPVAEAKTESAIEATTTSGEASKGGSRGSEFLKSIFGISGETSGEEKGNKGKGFLEDIFGSGKSDNQNEGSKASSSNTVQKLEEKIGGDITGKVSNIGNVEKVSGQLTKKSETFTENKSIIQTDTQKLGSPIIQPNKDAGNKDTNSTVTEQKPVTESLTTSNESTTLGTPDQGTTSQVENTNTKTSGSENNEAMAIKMDAMINLLSQLNDTLSGPLLVTSSQKKFE